MSIDSKFKYDGDASIGRVVRSIIMMIDAALESLRARGYDRVKDNIQIEQDDDGTHRIVVGNRLAYTVSLGRLGDDSVSVDGIWCDGQYPPPSNRR